MPTARNSVGIPLDQVNTINKWRRTVTSPRLSGGAQAGIESGLGNLVGSYNTAYDEARRANETRYQQSLGIADQDFTRRMGGFQAMLSQIGQTSTQAQTDIRARTQEQIGSATQQRARRGMSGTTGAAVERRGIEREGQASINRLTDQLLGRKLDVMRDISTSDRSTRLGIMERRTDAYPNQEALLQMISQVGEGFGSAATPSIMKALGQLRA